MPEDSQPYASPLHWDIVSGLPLTHEIALIDWLQSDTLDFFA